MLANESESFNISFLIFLAGQRRLRAPTTQRCLAFWPVRVCPPLLRSQTWPSPCPPTCTLTMTCWPAASVRWLSRWLKSSSSLNIKGKNAKQDRCLLTAMKRWMSREEKGGVHHCRILSRPSEGSPGRGWSRWRLGSRWRPKRRKSQPGGWIQCKSTHLQVEKFVCLPAYLSLYLSIHPSFYLSIGLSVCLSVYLSVLLFVCVPVWVSSGYVDWQVALAPTF